MTTNSAGLSGVRERKQPKAHENMIVSDHLPSTSHGNAMMLLCMLIDGVGLAVIAGCTIYEGIDLWGDYFNEYQDQNMSSLAFWFTGRFLQVMGLILLISHAASFQVFHEIESAGMVMLTAGPILNICACSLFDSGIDPLYLYNKQWMSSEVLELVGISILDLSLIEAEEYIVLAAEVTGFAILACAAILDFDYEMGKIFPKISVRMDLLHCSDCFGLFLLTVVAVMQYRMKVAKHQQQQHYADIKHQQLQQQHQHVGSAAQQPYSRIGNTTAHIPQKYSDKQEDSYKDRVHHRDRTISLGSSHRSDLSDTVEQGLSSDLHAHDGGLLHLHAYPDTLPTPNYPPSNSHHEVQVPHNKSSSSNNTNNSSSSNPHIAPAAVAGPHGHGITGYRMGHLDHDGHDD